MRCSEEDGVQQVIEQPLEHMQSPLHLQVDFPHGQA